MYYPPPPPLPLRDRLLRHPLAKPLAFLATSMLLLWVGAWIGQKVLA